MRTKKPRTVWPVTPKSAYALLDTGLLQNLEGTTLVRSDALWKKLKGIVPKKVLEQNEVKAEMDEKACCCVEWKPFLRALATAMDIKIDAGVEITETALLFALGPIAMKSRSFDELGEWNHDLVWE